MKAPKEVDGEALKHALEQVAKTVAGAALPPELTAQRATLLSEAFSTGYLLMQEAVDVARRGTLKNVPREQVTLDLLRRSGSADVAVLLNALEALSLVLGRFTPRVEFNLGEA